MDYNNALRLLRQYIVTTPVPQFSREVILISIAILYGAARSIGKLEDAKTHLRAASEILNSWMKSKQRSGQTSQSSGDFASLLEVFSKISLQATLFDDTLPSSYLNDSETEDMTTMTYGSMIANQFQNAIEAQHALETIQSRFFRFIVVNRKPDCHGPTITTTDNNNHFPPFVYTEITMIATQVAFWRSSFQEILDTSSYNQPNGATGPVRHHTALLYAQHWTLVALVRSSMQLLNGQKPSSPRLNAHAGRVLALLRSNFVFPSSQPPEAEEKEKEEPLEKIICKPSATPPLYLELAQQRDFAVQSKAIELLTDTLNHEDMTNVLRVLNLLMAIGRKESRPFYNHRDSARDLVASQKELERLVQVLDEWKC